MVLVRRPVPRAWGLHVHPSPGHLSGEDATEKGAGHAGDAENSAHEANVRRYAGRRDYEGNNCVYAACDAGASEAGNGTSDDQGDTVLSDT